MRTTERIWYDARAMLELLTLEHSIEELTTVEVIGDLRKAVESWLADPSRHRPTTETAECLAFYGGALAVLRVYAATVEDEMNAAVKAAEDAHDEAEDRAREAEEALDDAEQRLRWEEQRVTTLLNEIADLKHDLKLSRESVAALNDIANHRRGDER